MAPTPVRDAPAAGVFVGEEQPRLAGQGQALDGRRLGEDYRTVPKVPRLGV